MLLLLPVTTCGASGGKWLWCCYLFCRPAPGRCVLDESTTASTAMAMATGIYIRDRLLLLVFRLQPPTLCPRKMRWMSPAAMFSLLSLACRRRKARTCTTHHPCMVDVSRRCRACVPWLQRITPLQQPSLAKLAYARPTFANRFSPSSHPDGILAQVWSHGYLSVCVPALTHSPASWPGLPGRPSGCPWPPGAHQGSERGSERE